MLFWSRFVYLRSFLNIPGHISEFVRLCWSHLQCYVIKSCCKFIVILMLNWSLWQGNSFHFWAVTAAVPDHSSSCHEEHRRCVRDAQFQNCKLCMFGHVFNTTKRKMHTTALISWLEKCSWVKSLRIHQKRFEGLPDGVLRQMIRRPQLDIIRLHGCILKLVTIKMNGKESGLSKPELDKFKWKTFSQLGKGSVVGACWQLQLGILIAAVMTATFWKKMPFLRHALYRTSLL